MGLITPTMPPAILRAFNLGLGDFISPSDPLWSVLLKRFIGLQTHGLNLDLYVNIAFDPDGKPLPLDSVSSFDSLVQSTGWRFLAADGDVYGGCHVGSVDPSLPPKLTGFSRDVEVLTAIEQFNELSTIDEVNTCTFEPRVLRISWLRFEAFWLHVPDSTSQPQCYDLVIPYFGFVKRPLELMQPKPISGFLTAIQPFAKRSRDLVARYPSSPKAEPVIPGRLVPQMPSTPKGAVPVAPPTPPKGGPPPTAPRPPLKRQVRRK